MKFSPPLGEAVLIKRYKRFLADVTLSQGQQITLHCPNTGSMLNCQTPGSKVWFSTSDNPARKYAHTLELVEVDGQFLVGVNTARANRLVEEALQLGAINELQGYSNIIAEATLPNRGTRIDFRLENAKETCYVEVKNVTLGDGRGVGYFPDAVTERGTKHLQELLLLKQQGYRAVLLFCVQHQGVNRVEPARLIDPLYSKTLLEVSQQGVEVLAYRAVLSPQEICLRERISVSCAN